MAIKTIETYKVIGTPGYMDGSKNLTFYYEEGEDHAVDEDGLYHQIADVDSADELKEYAALGYANDDEKFFTNYAEDGHVSNTRRVISNKMKAFLKKKGII